MMANQRMESDSLRRRFTPPPLAVHVQRLVAGLGTEVAMRTFIVVFGAVLMLCTSLARADTERSVAVSGAGRDACSAWLSDRSSTSASAEAASQARIEWISGFLSGVNLFAESSGHLKGGVDDPDGVKKWIDNYCRAHPTDPLWVAVGDLVLDLRNHQRE